MSSRFVCECGTRVEKNRFSGHGVGLLVVEERIERGFAHVSGEALVDELLATSRTVVTCKTCSRLHLVDENAGGTIQTYRLEIDGSSTRPQLRDCLAYVILDDPATWLGEPSPRMLQAFLDGAKARAELTRQTLESWRVYGPLDEPDFYLPIVARTGHPTLSIRWATALESINYSMLDSMLELKALIARWFEERGFDSGSRVGQSASDADLPRLLRRLARRPGLFLGEPCGWRLHCYLAGMDRGGDWLGLPPLPGLREVVDGIAERSLESYGSTFAAYRIYNRSPEELLAWVGIKPA